MEIYLGRLSVDFSKVEAWARVTTNGAGDSYPDVWIDVGNSPHPRLSGPIGPVKAATGDRPSASAAAGRLVVSVRLTRPGPIPAPESILPYRAALVVNEYDIVQVLDGAYSERTMQIAQWAIRDGRLLEGKKIAGAAFTLTVERYDAHPELEGERLVSDGPASRLPLYLRRRPAVGWRVVFSSYLFLFYFLPAALLLYYAGPRRARHLSLTIVSYVFYGWANPLFLPLLLGSTAVDYVAGRVMAHHPLEPGPDGPRRRARPARIALVASICSNLTLLGFFKYYNFGAENIDALAQAMGLPAWGLGALRVTLPLGISFYTFQSMSYAIDVYRGDAAPIRSFIDFACFVSMFPQLVAGPIIRFSEVADQLRFRTHTTTKFARGIAFWVSAWRRRCSSPIPAARSPTSPSTPDRSASWRRGTAPRPTRSKSTSTSAATRTWRSASA